MVLGERLRDARKAKNLSQEELAKQLFISRSALAKWETGQSMPDIRMLKQLAHVLDVSLEYLASDDVVQPDAPVIPGFIRQVHFASPPTARQTVRNHGKRR